MEDNWISIDEVPENAMIRTLHTDGKEDICKVIEGEVYSYDPKTEAPITHFKVLTRECDRCDGTGYDPHPNHSTTHPVCPKCEGNKAIPTT